MKPTIPVASITYNIASCPFCRSNKTKGIDSMELNKLAVYCLSCHCKGPPAKDITQAVELWNGNRDAGVR